MQGHEEAQKREALPDQRGCRSNSRETDGYAIFHREKRQRCQRTVEEGVASLRVDERGVGSDCPYFRVEDASLSTESDG